ncbi:hypothetical protein GALL_510980 [mine drainage metagenome]|uniref:Uncharacterized protein n=1 Tax=mine drainage metagenome TaxID=410659 RepID=A0A1J5P6W3_9ZZZZ
MSGDFCHHVDRHIGHARQRPDGGNQVFAKPGNLAFGRVAQFDIKNDIAGVDRQVSDGFCGYKIDAGVGVNHLFKSLQHNLF